MSERFSTLSTDELLDHVETALMGAGVSPTVCRSAQELHRRAKLAESPVEKGRAALGRLMRRRGAQDDES